MNFKETTTATRASPRKRNNGQLYSCVIAFAHFSWLPSVKQQRETEWPGSRVFQWTLTTAVNFSYNCYKIKAMLSNNFLKINYCSYGGLNYSK